jgi:hypothetical protein
VRILSRILLDPRAAACCLLQQPAVAAAAWLWPPVAPMPSSAASARQCVLISFMAYNLGLTNKPIKGPPQGVCACPHNNTPLIGLTPDVCVCFNLSLSITVVSPELWRRSST